MLHAHRRVGDARIAPKGYTELGDAITVGMQRNITPPLLLPGHTLAAHLFANGRQYSLQGIHPRIRRCRRIDHAKQLVVLSIALGDKLFRNSG